MSATLNTFWIACKNGNVEMAQQILSENPTIDVLAAGEHAFRVACSNGHLKIAQLLISVKPDIDISAPDCWGGGNQRKCIS